MLDTLPHYIECDECDNPHFLSLNRDLYGRWAMAYVEFELGEAICPLNDVDTLEEGVLRMKASLKRAGY